MIGFIRRMFWGDPPPPPAPEPRDIRDWNEDWRVGDTAECVATADTWADSVPPWNRPSTGTRLIVTGFKEGLSRDKAYRAYFLLFAEHPAGLTTTAFRKVRPVASENSEIVERILKAKPGEDIKRVAPKRQPAA